MATLFQLKNWSISCGCLNPMLIRILKSALAQSITIDKCCVLRWWHEELSTHFQKCFSSSLDKGSRNLPLNIYYFKAASAHIGYLHYEPNCLLFGSNCCVELHKNWTILQHVTMSGIWKKSVIVIIFLFKSISVSFKFFLIILVCFPCLKMPSGACC